MTANIYLNELYAACTGSSISRQRIKSALEDLLIWLNEPANNTNENCRQVDLFVTFQIEPEKLDYLPEDIQEILADLGGALHDTHTSPDIAENFCSTPRQLLERVRKVEE